MLLRALIMMTSVRLFKCNCIRQWSNDKGRKVEGYVLKKYLVINDGVD